MPGMALPLMASNQGELHVFQNQEIEMKAQIEAQTTIETNRVIEWCGGVFVHSEIYRNRLLAICQMDDGLVYLLGDPADFETYELNMKTLEADSLKEAIDLLRAEVEKQHRNDIQNIGSEDADLFKLMAG